MNNIIWKGWPIDKCVGKRSLELLLSSVVITFNDGFAGIMKVLSVNNGRFRNEATKLHDTLRISKANHKSTNKSIVRRQKLL